MVKMKDSGIEWIGEIPEDWEVAKQKYYINLINGRAYSDNEFEEDGKYKILRVGNLFTNPIWYTSSLELPQDKYCNKGDLLYSWSMSYAPVIWNGEKVIYHYHIWKANLLKQLNKKYAYYYLLSLTDALRSEIHETTMGFITMGIMNNSYISIPPKETQKRIADFLDAKCGKIDELKNDIQKQIETLEQYKKSVITEAVTKGINPNAKMKNSGIEWIGMVSEKAEIFRLKFFSYMKGRIGWQGLKSTDFIDEGPYCVTGTDFINGKVNWDTCYHVSEKRYEMDSNIHIKKGDLLMTKDGTIGKLAIIDELPGKACLNSHLLIIRPLENKFTNKYLFYVMKSHIFSNYYTLVSSGTTMDSLSQEKTGDFSIPAYPIDEQNKIADYLDSKCSSIDNIIASKKQQLEKLDEYKKSLIFEYVTGKESIA